MEMRIEILSIEDVGDDCVIRIATPYGKAAAVWKGRTRPTPGMVIVEFEASGDADDLECLRASPKEQYSMESRKDGVYLTGKLEGPYEFGVGLRVGESVLLLDRKLGDLNVGQWVELGPVRLEAYPVQY